MMSYGECQIESILNEWKASKQKTAGPFEIDQTVFAVEPFDDPIFRVLPSNVSKPGAEAEKVGTLN